MKYFIRKVAFLLVFIASFTGLGVSVQAEKLNFSVTPIISSSQRQDVKTYFDLRVTPGVDEVLQVEVENLSDQDMTVLASANTVVTNDNVIADYSQHDPELNHTLKYPFSDIAKIDPEIKLKPKEKKVVDVKVDIPDEDDDKESGSLLIENNFAFMIGVRLSENDEKVPVKIDLLNVRAGQRNYRNTVLVTFENPEPRILPDVEIESFLYSEKDLEEALYYDKIDHAEIAPNSSFDYGISLNDNAYQPGTYVLKTTVKTLGERFEFEKKFSISNYEAKKLNDEAVDLIKPEFDWTKFILVLFFALLIIIIVLVVLVIKYKRKPTKKKQSQQDKRKNRQKKKKR